eukprot:SAG11_NODE_20341_length_447_cov_1.591954_2_plen_37_part_01
MRMRMCKKLNPQLTVVAYEQLQIWGESAANKYPEDFS